MTGRSLRHVLFNLAVFTLLACLLGACTSPDERNVIPNPTFEGADRQIPPPGWNLVGKVDDNRSLSLIEAAVPAKRGLLIEDWAFADGADGEIGIYVDVPAKAGKTYRAELTYHGYDDEPTGSVTLQIRFLPSNEERSIRFHPVDLAWTTVAVQGTAPSDTTTVRVSLVTGDSSATVLTVQSLNLFEVD